ncbi:MAG: STAS domain-containing protein [Actinobacteria bacterium]|nr:STAS domain-containing protein [Actinomycetota bacterium]
MHFEITDGAIDAETHLVEASGELDLSSADELERRLRRAAESGKRFLIVDLARASFIDSATIGVLVSANKQLRPLSGAIALVCTDRLTTRILEITGIDRAFAVCASRAEALESLRSRRFTRSDPGSRQPQPHAGD